jgi:hypothetical protein
VIETVSMKTATEIALNRWPYGLELQASAGGLLLRPRRKARAKWAKNFRRARAAKDELAATRNFANEFDVKEWQW